MKKNVILLFIICQSIVGFTQTPQKMSYQAVIRNEENELLYEEQVGVRISILRGSENIYTETHTVTSNMNGLITLEIGAGTTTDNFSKIDWGKGPYFIKTETDIKGGTNYSITTISQMLSVPYALYAEKAKSTDYMHYIGELFGGGIICDLWKDSLGEEHGLIMSLIDIGDTINGQNWNSGPVVLVGAFNQFDGLENSIKIAKIHPQSAAAICLNSTHGGYDDWYLPTWSEMNNFFDRRVLRTLTKTPGAMLFKISNGPFRGYCSSLEIDAIWIFSWYLGQFYSAQKQPFNPNPNAPMFYIRPVRRF